MNDRWYDHPHRRSSVSRPGMIRGFIADLLGGISLILVFLGVLFVLENLDVIVALLRSPLP